MTFYVEPFFQTKPKYYIKNLYIESALKMKSLLILCSLLLILVFDYGNSESLFGDNRNNGKQSDNKL